MGYLCYQDLTVLLDCIKIRNGETLHGRLLFDVEFILVRGAALVKEPFALFIHLLFVAKNVVVVSKVGFGILE